MNRAKAEEIFDTIAIWVYLAGCPDISKIKADFVGILTNPHTAKAKIARLKKINPAFSNLLGKLSSANLARVRTEMQSAGLGDKSINIVTGSEEFYFATGMKILEEDLARIPTNDFEKKKNSRWILLGYYFAKQFYPDVP